jgi:hypothetical protein
MHLQLQPSLSSCARKHGAAAPLMKGVGDEQQAQRLLALLRQRRALCSCNGLQAPQRVGAR